MKLRDKKATISENNQSKPLLLTFPKTNNNLLPPEEPLDPEYEKKLCRAKQEAIEKILPAFDDFYPEMTDEINKRLIYHINHATSSEEVSQLISGRIREKIISYSFHRQRFVIDNNGRIVDCEDILSWEKGWFQPTDYEEIRKAILSRMVDNEDQKWELVVFFEGISCTFKTGKIQHSYWGLQLSDQEKSILPKHLTSVKLFYSGLTTFTFNTEKEYCQAFCWCSWKEKKYSIHKLVIISVENPLLSEVELNPLLSAEYTFSLSQPPTKKSDQTFFFGKEHRGFKLEIEWQNFFS